MGLYDILILNHERAPLYKSDCQIKLSDFFKQLHYIQNATHNYTNTECSIFNTHLYKWNCTLHVKT
jgi:hypothetical protein